MPFNAHSYYANKFAREARSYIAKARDIKARAARGEAYDWELPSVASYAKLAILHARMARTRRTLATLSKPRRF